MTKNICFVALGIFCACVVLLCSTPKSLALAATPTPVYNSAYITSHTASLPPARLILIKVKSSWPWYTARAAGLVAAALLVALIFSGIGQITGLTYRIMEPLAAWRLHRALGIAFGGSVALHVIALLFDTFVPFNIIQVLVPFLSGYKPVTLFGLHVGSLYVALGVLSLYATAALILSSLLWIDKKPIVWRTLHFISYLLVVMVFVHALYLGTDLQHGILRLIWLAVGILLSLGIISRVRRARTMLKKDGRKA